MKDDCDLLDTIYLPSKYPIGSVIPDYQPDAEICGQCIKIADRVAKNFPIKPDEIFQPGKQPVKVKARSLLCYWTVRELGITMVELASRLNISQPAVSVCVRHGERMASQNDYSLTDE